MRLYTIRHGQSFGNLPGADGVNSDPGLTDVGKEQATRLAEWLPKFLPEVDAIYCSSMRRVRETVAPLAVAYVIAPIFEDTLREIGTNRWNHLAYDSDEIPPLTAGFWAAEYPFRAFRGEDGESLMHFRTRIGRFMEELRVRHYGETVVVVCHGGVVEFIFDHVFNIGPWRRCDVKTRNTGISLLEYVELPRREAWRLHFHDRAEHLNA
jgi:probable phosphoglycerate mutase